jgi:calcium-binding protein CML
MNNYQNSQQKQQQQQQLDPDLFEAFKLFDKNKDGYIDASELKNLLHKLGEPCSDDDVRKS